MLGVLSIGLISSCATEEQQAKVNVLLVKQKQLKDELMEGYAKYKAGELTQKELAKLSERIQDNIEETKDAVEKLQEEGLGIGSLIAAVAIGVATRGRPASGPLAAVLNKLIGKKED